MWRSRSPPLPWPGCHSGQVAPGGVMTLHGRTSTTATGGRRPMAGNEVLNICFHGVGIPRRELEPGEDRYWVDADRYLRILDEIATWPLVRISFDDANASDAELGLPGRVE